MKNTVLFALILISLAASCRISENKQEEPRIVQEMTIAGYSIEDAIDPPPPGFISRFKTIEEWMDNIYKLEEPKTKIDEYVFGIFYGTDIKSGSDTIYTFTFSGERTYLKDGNSQTKIEFSPKSEDAYFTAPLGEYGKLNYRQACEKLKTQLRQVIRSEKFQASFLSKAKLITTDCGDTLWRRESDNIYY